MHGLTEPSGPPCGKSAIKIGVMGSASTSMPTEDLHRVDAARQAIGPEACGSGVRADYGCAGSNPGARRRSTYSQHGGLSVGVSPASSAVEHAALYATPPCSSTVVIYSGFGFKGRNVIAVRSADIVLLFSGGIGTLNEFTIAYDEGKVIGLLQGTGGAADLAQTLLDTLPCARPARSSSPTRTLSNWLSAASRGCVHSVVGGGCAP